MTVSSSFGSPITGAEGFRAACVGCGLFFGRRVEVSPRGFPGAVSPRAGLFFRSARAAGNNTAALALGSPGAPSPGTNLAALAHLPR
jgi:hypothetical protein